MVVPFDRLAGALLPEEGWEVSSLWLEPTRGGGSGEPTDAQRVSRAGG
jgi:hypothetical protein